MKTAMQWMARLGGKIKVGFFSALTALALGTAVSPLVSPPAAQAADEGIESKMVAFGTNGVASIAIPANRPVALLKYIQLIGLNTAAGTTNTATALQASEGSTNGSFAITYIAGAGRYTNAAADYAYGSVEAIVVRLTNTALLSSSITTNTYTNALFGGVTYTNIITNMNSRLRVLWQGYSE